MSFFKVYDLQDIPMPSHERFESFFENMMSKRHFTYTEVGAVKVS